MTTVVPDRKIALVTGGGSGIGRTTAVKFSINGYNVIVADIDKKSVDETVEFLPILYRYDISIQKYGLSM